MSLSKRIKSIIIISLISVAVICGYYLVNYFLHGTSNDSYYKFTDDELAQLKDIDKIEIYMLQPEYMFYAETEDSESEEKKGFSFPSASKVGEKLGETIRESIALKGIAPDTGKRADEYETVINGHLQALDSEVSNIKYFHDEKGEYSKKYKNDDENRFVVFKKDETIIKANYDDFFVTLKDGTKYAFDRYKIINIINSLSGKSESDKKSLVALKGFDTDGDTVSLTGYPFVYPAITSRYEVEYIRVKNKNGTFAVIQDIESGNFYFEDALTMAYDPEKFSKMLMSGIYMLSKGKVENPVSLSEYGLDSDENATAIVEILKKDETFHKVIIGNKTLDGKGYYAKYFEKDFVYIISNEIENGLLLSAMDFLQTSLVHTVSTVEGIYSVDDIHVKFLGENKELHVELMDDDDDDGSQIFSIWKILSPEELIPIGRPFGNPNSSAFTEFIQSAATLATEQVVEYKMTEIPVSGNVIAGISEEALEKFKKETILSFSDETLSKYDLSTPRLEVSYSYPYKDSKSNEYTIVSRVFISEEQEDEKYYAYSYLYTYDSNGKLTEILCTGCITTLTLANVNWLDWDVMDFNNQFLYKNFFYNLDWIEVEYNGEIYRFNVDGNPEEEDINSVTLVHNGTSKDIDTMSFKYMYSSILEIYMVDNYDIADENPNMMCRITIHATGGSTEMKFYRVTNTKAFYTLNGEGKYYVKAASIFNFLEKYQMILDGKIITRDDW